MERRASTPIRNFVCAALVAIGFTAVCLQLYSVQIKQTSEFQKLSLENFIQTQRLEHDRGEILDREGRVLVSNRPSFNVTVTPAFLPDPRRTIEKLGAAAGVSRADAAALAIALRRSAEDDGPPILLARDLEESEVRALREKQRQLDVPLEGVPVIEVEPGLHAAYLDPKVFPSSTRVFATVAAIIGLDAEERVRAMTRAIEARGLSRYREILIRHDVPPAITEQLTRLIELGDLPGFELREGRARDYREGQLAAHLLGYVNELSPQELEEKKEGGYRLGDLIGRRGVEKTFEEELRGVDGFEPIVVDSKGRTQESALADLLREGVASIREAPRAGNRVVLTLDRDLQYAAERGFEASGGLAGAIVALDVHTGGILALTSTPTYDPNRVTGFFDPREKARLDGMRKLRPWRFRPIQDHFAPGSTFKVVTALAGLGRRVTHPHEHIHCGGAMSLGSHRFRCWRAGGHGGVEIIGSLAKSCDVYYYTLGKRMGLDPIADMAHALGFGDRTGFEIPGESPGIMPTEKWYDDHQDGYTLGAAVNASIGQGAVAVTPLQLAVAYAAIANGGTVWEPHVALRVESVDGAVKEIPPKARRKVDLPEEHLALVREGLKRVVNHASGTAYRRRLPEIEVAGKTGTAQVAKLGAKRIDSDDLPWEVRDHAWFAAYAPADNPQIAVVVLHEHGGHGSSGAAPIAMAVIRAWHEKRQLRAGLSPRSSVEVAFEGEEEQPDGEDGD